MVRRWHPRDLSDAFMCASCSLPVETLVWLVKPDINTHEAACPTPSLQHFQRLVEAGVEITVNFVSHNICWIYLGGQGTDVSVYAHS